MSKLSVTNLESIKKQMQGEIASKAMPQILKKVFINITPSIRDLIVDIMQETQAWQGLRGVFADDRDRDTQAILGVTDSEVSSALNEIVNIVEDTILINNVSARSGGRFSTVPNATSINFTLSTPELENRLLSSSVGEYTSKSGESIPWMNWLLRGGSVSGYDVVFDFYNLFEGGNGIAGFSRTGRAIMLKFGSWSTEEYGRWSQGENFLDDITQDPKLVQGINKLLENEISKVIKTGNFRV